MVLFCVNHELYNTFYSLGVFDFNTKPSCDIVLCENVVLKMDTYYHMISSPFYFYGYLMVHT